MARIFTCSLVLSLVVLLSACGDSGTRSATVGDADSGGDVGSLWVVNLMTDSLVMGLEVEGHREAVADYGQSTRRLDFRPGPRRITLSVVTPRLGVAGSIVEPLPFSETVNLATGEEAVAVFHGSIDDPALDIWKSDAIGNGSGRVGLLNYSTRQLTVDMYLTGADNSPSDSDPLISTGEPGFDGLVAVEADQYQLEFTSVGTSDVVYDAALVDITQDSSSYFIITDFFSSDPNSVMVLELARGEEAQPLTDTAIPHDLRFINGIADYPAVDVYLGDTTGTPMLANVGFKHASGYLQVERAEDMLIVTPAGVKDVEFYRWQVPGPEDSWFHSTQVVSGLSTEAYTWGQSKSDELRPRADVAIVSFLHAAVSSGPVDIYLLAEDETFGNTAPALDRVEYREPGGALAVPEGQYTLYVTPNGSNPILIGPLALSLDSGEILDYVLFDADGGGLPIQLEAYSYSP